MNKEQQQQQIPLYAISPDVIEKNQNNEKVSLLFVTTLCRRLHEHSGIWYMLTATFIFACCSFALKLVPADVFDIMIVRFSIHSLVFGVFATFYKHYNVFDTNGQPIACLLNIVMSIGTNFTYLAALSFIPLSDLNTIRYTYIVWAAILSVLFLKERFKIVNTISLFLTILGLIFATKPHFFIKTLGQIFDPSSSSSMLITTTTTLTTSIANTTTPSSYYYLGIGFAFLSAFAKATQFIARKQLLITKQPHSVMNFQYAGVALLVSLIYSIIRRFWQPEPYPWRWMGIAGVIIGFFRLLSVILFAKALKREKVQVIAIITSLDIVFAVLLQYIFFRQTKSLIFYLGASLIVLSAIILSVEHHSNNKRERKTQIKHDENHQIKNNI
ncbi:unnamed protein product [Rotaria sp. Silwood1]|nr:unnamed protein product [Rotaria sp. Silwood1]CAF3420067.1 unnamed protein product [Rotaria sp. Silwood1]CAF4913924.1 unnamed protein product [Rotaria sp. Silwood1]